MALCLPSSALFARLHGLYRDNRKEIIYITEIWDSSISEKNAFQGTDAFLFLPEEIWFDVDVSGTSFYLVASFVLTLSLPPDHDFFFLFAKFLKLFLVTMELFLM